MPKNCFFLNIKYTLQRIVIPSVYAKIIQKTVKPFHMGSITHTVTRDFYILYIVIKLLYDMTDRFFNIQFHTSSLKYYNFI